jgi:ADP-ribose pyrophosphatase YjhB (NUDIX family)
MRFCSDCGGRLSFRIPEDDDRERFICDACETIHYINPRMVVGILPTWQDKVLLCQRAIEPRHGFWTLPAGFLENGESSEQGARRETWEEARATVQETSLYCLFDLPHISQIYLFYRAELADENFAPGPESLDVKLVRQDEIEWDKLAFPVMGRVLKHYFADREKGRYPVRHIEMLFNRHRKTRK